MQCLQEIDSGRPGLLPATVGRLLALRRPPGALEALLAYLPAADSDEAEAALVQTLADLGNSEGKVNTALVDALGDRIAVRRAAAAEALCRGRPASEFASVRKLFQDPDADVRLRAALALARLYQSTTRPTAVYAVLAPALEGFSATAEMPEIADAQVLLERLANGESAIVSQV